MATLVPEGALRTALELAAAPALSGVLALWVRANRIAIELQGRRDGSWRQATIAVATLARPVDLFRPEHPHLGPRRERATSAGSPLDRKDLGHAPFVTATRG